MGGGDASTVPGIAFATHLGEFEVRERTFPPFPASKTRLRAAWGARTAS